MIKQFEHGSGDSPCMVVPCLQLRGSKLLLTALSEKFSWLRRYPIASEMDLDPLIPHSMMLLGKEMVPSACVAQLA